MHRNPKEKSAEEVEVGTVP